MITRERSNRKKRKEVKEGFGLKRRECREVRYRPTKEEVDTGSRVEEEPN